MSTHFDHDAGDVSLELERLIDRLCDQFEAELRRGKVPSLQEYLAAVSSEGRTRLRGELIALLHEFRIEAEAAPALRSPKGSTHEDRIANAPTEHDLINAIAAGLHRPPADIDQAEIRDELLAGLLDIEMRSRASAEKVPDLTEFLERFPMHRRVVKALYFEHFVPRSIGHFHVKKLLGSGSFGKVYLATDPKLQREVAIKVFRHRSRLPATGGLLNEARAAASLRHDGIVSVHAIHEDEDGFEFLVLDYVHGTTLEDVLAAKSFSPVEAVRLVLGIAEAVYHAHQADVVHRDLKPANVLVDRDGRPRLTDFGLALRSTDTRETRDIVGTVDYMAPEQIRGETHLVDARTDIWAIGVILYRLLVNRLPFVAESRPQLFAAICTAAPRCLADVAPGMPSELARIVDRCLEKRMADRYQSGRELVDDLTAFLNRPGLESDSVRDATLAVASKGLCAFDAHDRDNYLHLVPGPRDRYGIPEAVRFWERRLGASTQLDSFRVGLIYGPSGSGKSSLLRAGVIPRLPSDVKLLVIEATAEGFENRLLDELRSLVPDLEKSLGLVATVAELRERGTGPKIVIAIDQFEQWLHAWNQNDSSELIEALRQCDGSHVQVVLVIRDDFWMSARRVFHDIDHELSEGQNAQLVDLFDRSHAVKVLTAFGKASGRLRIDVDPTGEQAEFINRAIDRAAQGGRVVPVRLCMLAEMIKHRVWISATLDEIDGLGGLGVAFLTEAFEGASALPQHRSFGTATRRVLERFVPTSGSDIRGPGVLVDDLYVASELSDRNDFQRLLHCLDRELHLLTPASVSPGSEPDGSDGLRQDYQLTHDYLVPAIREWLQFDRRRTAAGRAELRLAEYGNLYRIHPSAQQLPSTWEWLTMQALTRSRKWSADQKRMMRAATSRHLKRISVVALAVVGILGVTYLRVHWARTDALLQALETSDAAGFGKAVSQLQATGPLATSRLTAKASAATASDGTNSQELRLLAGAAILTNSDQYAESISAGLLSCDTPLALAVIAALSDQGRLPAVANELSDVLADEESSLAEKLTAIAALARLNEGDRETPLPSDTASHQLQAIEDNPALAKAWSDTFRPASRHLLPALQAHFVDENLNPPQRLIAARLLSDYLHDDTESLVALALKADPKQLQIIVQALAGRQVRQQDALKKVADNLIPPESDEYTKDNHARQQANAIVLLRAIGDDTRLLPALRHQPDPRLRSFLIDHFQQNPIEGREWITRLSEANDVGIKQALLLFAGQQQVFEDREGAIEAILTTYMKDPNAGVHSAAEWALRQQKCTNQLQDAKRTLAKVGYRANFDWYVEPNLMTMIVVKAPGQVVLGSPLTEPNRNSDEPQEPFDIHWNFAISTTEVTHASYAEVCQLGDRTLGNTTPSPDCPASGVTWSNAIRYCRLLSEAEGIAEDEMAIPAAGSIGKEKFPDFRTRSGYRLPSKEEWEYVCRSNTVTPRPFGFAPQLMSRYCTFALNAEGTTGPVGARLPNQFGAFDMLGNVTEWCLTFDRQKKDSFVPVHSSINRYVVRGNDFQSHPSDLRTANWRDENIWELRNTIGFRVARTVKSTTP